MSYFALSRNGDESFIKFLSPDSGSDHLRGAATVYSILCKIIKSIQAVFFSSYVTLYTRMTKLLYSSIFFIVYHYVLYSIYMSKMYAYL